ncbi:helix-turn-helix transcriptional regulator [Paenibacillus caui]|uniref:helix-turn-helix transcriptional regulator n=1 Tax=Paenibacillus caui TaxID=2873927 RepID=UPI001CA972BA|nr:helix-turn-helix transcriptional regulator [Paenibacillus caui]
MERRKELGDFLKSRRNRMQPADYGLSAGPRRKAKGLRREELAQLAGIGQTWYTWLEQGRDINVSAGVLESLARIMRMDAEERKHLFLLAHHQLPITNQEEDNKGNVRTVLQNFLEHWADCPAFMMDYKWDICAWNRAACVVFGDFAQMGPKELNAVWRCFMSASYKELFADWEGHARRLLASFRASCTRFIGEPWFKELVDELSEQSKEFRSWWPLHDIMSIPIPIGKKEIRHPKAGSMVMEHITFQVYDDPDLKVTLYRPLHEKETVEKLNKLLEEALITPAVRAPDKPEL